MKERNRWLIAFFLVVYLLTYIWLTRRPNSIHATYDLDGVFLVSILPEYHPAESFFRTVFWPANFLDVHLFGGEGFGAYPTFEIEWAETTAG